MNNFFDNFINKYYFRLKSKITDVYTDNIKIYGLNSYQINLIHDFIFIELNFLIFDEKYIYKITKNIIDNINCNLDTLLVLNKLQNFSKKDIIDLIQEVIVWYYDYFILDYISNQTNFLKKRFDSNISDNIISQNKPVVKKSILLDNRNVKINDDPKNFRSWLYK